MLYSSHFIVKVILHAQLFGRYVILLAAREHSGGGEKNTGVDLCTWGDPWVVVG